MVVRLLRAFTNRYRLNQLSEPYCAMTRTIRCGLRQRTASAVRHASKMHPCVVCVPWPALLAGILSTAVPAYAIDPSPAAQIAQQALSVIAQKDVPLLDKAISTWRARNCRTTNSLVCITAGGRPLGALTKQKLI